MYLEYEYEDKCDELAEAGAHLFKESRMLTRIASLVVDTTDENVEDALSDAFLSQVDAMIPLMKRMIKTREDIQILELKMDLKEEED